MEPVSQIAGLSQLWQRAGAGDPAIRIAIIDGPIDLNHPALKGASLSLSGDGAETRYLIKSEHGTHVTSVLMGVPGSSVVGVAPNCSATVYSIYREGDDGALIPSSQATLALTINRALADGADVINISSGQLTPTGEAERILADSVRACDRGGKLIIAAAGNDGCNCLQVPASLGSVLAVGACDLDGQPLPFSNFGAAYLENGILAPGKDVEGASPSKGVALRSGTSFATPIVTGVIALLLSLQRRRGQKPDPRAVKEALLATATPCKSSQDGDPQRCLSGVLNIPAVIAELFADQQSAQEDSPSRSRENAPAFSAAGAGIANFPSIQPSQSARKTGGKDAMGAQTRGIEAAACVVGPDGHPARPAAVTPAEAPAAASEAASAGAAAGAPPAPPTPAATYQAGGMPYANMPHVATPHTVWVPVSMAGSMMPAGLQVVPAALAGGGVITAEALPQSPGVAGPAALRPSEGGCGCGVRPAQAQPSQVAYLDPVLTSSLNGPGGASQMAFPLGQVYYDFGKEARVDYFVQAIASWRDSLTGRGDPDFGPNRDVAGDLAAPYNPEIMARYLMDLAPGETSSPTSIDVNFRDADALIWTLTIDTIPVYAVKPLDVFGLGFYSSLALALWFQEVSPLAPNQVSTLARKAEAPTQSTEGFPPPGRITRVSFAGWLDPTATTRLLNGTVLPTLVTDWRGFYQWDLYTLLGDPPWPDGAADFLDRIYNEFRNTGVSPQDRALNYSAMNALRIKQVFGYEFTQSRRLDTVEVDKSTICRPDSDCYDVTYRFFDPVNVLTKARQVYQYTIDVADVVPVPVGRVRKWAVY